MPNKFNVILTRDAAHDLEELYSYIQLYDSQIKADFVLNSIEKIADSLSAFPERGSYPKELKSMGIHEYREIYFKPYRLIYKIIDKEVLVYLIVDGRRDMLTLLTQRLLENTKL